MVTLKSSYYKTKRVTMIIIAGACTCSIYKEKKKSIVAVYITLTRELCKMENVKISLPKNKGYAQHFPTDV